MDPHAQATFIPKRSVTGIDSERKGLGFFSLITLIIFLGTLAAAGGVFAYNKILATAVTSEKASLAAEEKKFDPEFISFIVQLNRRIEAAKTLLNSHVAVSSIFDTLQNTTLKSVQFQSFAFSSTPVAGTPMVSLSLKGVARDYTALAAESQEIGKNKYIKEPLFSNFTLSDAGGVNFTLAAFIDPKLLDYRSRAAMTAAPAESVPDNATTSAVITGSSTNQTTR